jgi:AraC-like DNA-binding protein
MHSTTEVFDSYEREAKNYPFIHIVKRTPEHISVRVDCTDGSGFAQIYYPLRGVYLSFFDFEAQAFLGGDGEAFRGIRLNYCIEGRCELCMRDDRYLFLEANDIAVTSGLAKNRFVFPQGTYHGVELYFQMPPPQDPPDTYLRAAGVDAVGIFESILGTDGHYVCKAAEEVKALLGSLRDPPEGYEVDWYRLKIAEVMMWLARLDRQPTDKRYCFYTKGQVEIAEQVMQVISADLGQRHSISQLAKAYGVSATSIRNYFKGVYGVGISEHLKKARLTAASEALSQTNMSVSEIAATVGYENASKFSAVFKAAVGKTPLEYRRRKRCGL